MKCIFILFLGSLLLCSCTSSHSANNLVDLNNVQDQNGFFELPLKIISKSSNDGYFEFTVQALSKLDTVEILISLKDGIPPGFVNGAPKNMFLEDGIQFQSTGARSDKLLNTISTKYGLKKSNLQMKTKQTFTCANLNQKPVSYKIGNPSFKIFLEDENHYAELYVNFNFANSIISLSEKDPEYREALIALMSK